MAMITPPYADRGLASFEVLDTYLQNFLLAGPHPFLQPAFGFPMPINTSFAQLTVVGLSGGKLAFATEGVDPAAATGAITFSGIGTADDTVTIGGRVYTLKAVPAAADQIDIGADAPGTAANLAAAINAAAGAGTLYGTGTTANANVSAVAVGAVVTLTARQAGALGNQVTTTEAGSGASFAAATLVGGADQGGVKAIGVLAHAVTLGASGAVNGQVWYSGCFNQDALVWHSSFDTDAKKQAAFMGSPTPTNIIVAKRGA